MVGVAPIPRYAGPSSTLPQVRSLQTPCPLLNSTHSFALKKGAFTTDIPVTDELDAPAVVPVPKENEKVKSRLSTMPEPKGKVDD